ncbi:MAG: aspartate aminotransferase family protein [Chloroflexota bacterium]
MIKTLSRTEQVIHDEREYVVQTYKRPPFVLVHGDGVQLFDTEGSAYTDWVAGIAVNALGYNDAGLKAAISSALDTGVLHVSNLYHTAPHTVLARLLVEASFADRAFFCNSGTEANEAAIKFARKVAYKNGESERRDIVTFTDGFHGRTMGSLALTPRDKYQKPFAPLMPGVRLASFNDVDSAAAAIDAHTAAVIVEPVQGEGGINVADPAFLQALRRLCDEHGALLIFDEVQCGVGRTGTLWAHEPAGVTPDIMTLAKPLAGGLPIGAVLVTEAVAGAMEPGDHGSTFAGGPVVASAAIEVLTRVGTPEFLKHVRQTGAYLIDKLRQLEHPMIEGVRGRGLMVAMQMKAAVNPIIDAAYAEGLLLVNAGPNVLRFVPPLVIAQAHVDQLVEKLAPILGRVLHD